MGFIYLITNNVNNKKYLLALGYTEEEINMRGRKKKEKICVFYIIKIGRWQYDKSECFL